MTFLVGMCGTTMVFKAGLAERCWNGDLNGVDDWQSDPKLFVVEIFKKRIWLESEWWQCTFAYVLSQCKYNILMFSYICIYTGIYIWFLCGYHVIHTIYIYSYSYVDFSWSVTFTFFNWIHGKVGFFGPSLCAEYLDHLWGNASRTTCNIQQKALSTKWGPVIG